MVIITGTDANGILLSIVKNDSFSRGIGNNHIDGGNGDGLLEGVVDNDTIYAGDRIDLIYGGGNDTIHYDHSSDVIYGEAGNDVNLGGVGACILTACTSKDILVFNEAAFPSDCNCSLMNIITDFSRGYEEIDLCALLSGYDPNPATTPIDIDTNELAWGFHMPTANGVWFRQSGGNTFVYADAGCNVAMADAVMMLNGLHDLSNGHFPGVLTYHLAVQSDSSSVIEDAPSTTVTGNVVANDRDADGVELSTTSMRSYAPHAHHKGPEADPFVTFWARRVVCYDNAVILQHWSTSRSAKTEASRRPAFF